MFTPGTLKVPETPTELKELESIHKVSFLGISLPFLTVRFLINYLLHVVLYFHPLCYVSVLILSPSRFNTYKGFGSVRVVEFSNGRLLPRSRDCSSTESIMWHVSEVVVWVFRDFAFGVM